MSHPGDGAATYEERIVGGVVVLSLRRGLHGEGEETLRERIDALVRQGHLQILMDLAQLPFVDSAELGRLIRCHLSVRKAGGKVRLCNLSERVTALMKASRLDTVLDLYPTEEEALAAIRDNRGA